MTRKRLHQRLLVLEASSVQRLFLLAVLLLYPVMTRANTVDPLLAVNAAVSCGVTYSCTPITSLRFSFTSLHGSQGVLHFTNLSGVNWHSLILTEVGEPAIDITCTSNIFACHVVPYGSNGARIVLRAFGNLPGVPAGKSFELAFGCKRDCLPWPSDLDFTGVANGVAPEPGSAIPLLTGLGAMLARRRSIVSRAMLHALA